MSCKASYDCGHMPLYHPKNKKNKKEKKRKVKLKKIDKNKIKIKYKGSSIL